MTKSDKPTALYRHYDKNNTLLYVGISIDAVGRYERHTNIASWAYESVRMDIKWFDCRFKALSAEKIAIRDEKPLHNIVYGEKKRSYGAKKLDKKPCYMTFDDDMSLLHSIHNQQTLFFSQLLARMDSEQRVHLTPNVRKKIISSIGSKTKNSLATARQILHKLVASNLITSEGGGTYMVNPRIYGHSNLRSTIKRKEELYLKVKYSEKKDRELHVGFLEDIQEFEIGIEESND